MFCGHVGVPLAPLIQDVFVSILFQIDFSERFRIVLARVAQSHDFCSGQGSYVRAAVRHSLCMQTEDLGQVQDIKGIAVVYNRMVGVF